MSSHSKPARLGGRPTILALLIGGLVLAGGIALIVVASSNSGGGGGDKSPRAAAAVSTTSAPSSTAPATTAPATTAPASTAPATTAPPSTAAKAKSTTKAAPSVKPITYTVKRGDNLTAIAKWFHMHGYGSLYETNKSVIGKDPNLIHPGQKITISSRGMTVSR